MSEYSYEKQLVAQKQLDNYKLESNPKIGIIMPVYNAANFRIYYKWYTDSILFQLETLRL